MTLFWTFPFTAVSHLLRKQTVLLKFSKECLYTMKLSESQMSLVLSPEVKRLASVFNNHGYEMRIAGGAVRDLLMDKTPHDLDFATTATPDEMKSMFEAEDVRVIDAGGEKHGTVTAHLEAKNFECTTLRIDKETDGRHAVVEFTKNWELDANRRDLTINAMFLGLDGTVYDYFEGCKHLQEKRVIFVGNADKRIQEDYLRILRYFRFYGRIADSSENHDSEVLESIKRNAKGLEQISGERIWVELKKIITGNYGGELVVKMMECGIGAYIGLPSTLNCSSLRLMHTRYKEHNILQMDIHPMTLLASGFSNEEEAIKFMARIKCSKKEREVLFHILMYRDIAMQFNSFKDVQNHFIDILLGKKRNKDVALHLVSELLKYVCQVNYIEDLNNWDVPRFPVNGLMIGEKGVPRKKINVAMLDLLEEWKKSDFKFNAEELLETLDMGLYT